MVHCFYSDHCRRLSVFLLWTFSLSPQAAHPEVVEQWDVTAADPALLVHLKSYRHSVPVPSHWRQKRKYLQNKRGMHKAPFQLPSFIAETGIQTMREAYAEAEESKGLKQKQREKIRPKTGKADIDYQVREKKSKACETRSHLSKTTGSHLSFCCQNVSSSEGK